MAEIDFLLSLEERKILKKIKKELKENIYFNINIQDKIYEVFNDMFVLAIKPEFFRFEQLKKNHTFQFTDALKQIKKAKVSDEVSLNKYEIEEKVPNYKECFFKEFPIEKGFRENVSFLSNYTKKIELFSELNKIHIIGNRFMASDLTSVAFFEDKNMQINEAHSMINPTHIQMSKEFDFSEFKISEHWICFNNDSISLYLKKESKSTASFFDSFKDLTLEGDRISFSPYLNKKEIQKIISTKLKKQTTISRQMVIAEITNKNIYIDRVCVASIDNEINAKISAADLLPFWNNAEWYLNKNFLYEKIINDNSRDIYVLQKQ